MGILTHDAESGMKRATRVRLLAQAEAQRAELIRRVDKAPRGRKHDIEAELRKTTTRCLELSPRPRRPMPLPTYGRTKEAKQ